MAQKASQEGEEQEKDFMKKESTTKEEIGLLAAEYPTSGMLWNKHSVDSTKLFIRMLFIRRQCIFTALK